MSTSALPASAIGDYGRTEYSITKPLLRLAGFLACFDLVGAMAASGFFKAYLGEQYFLMQPPVAVMVVIAMHFAIRPRRLDRGLLTVAIAFVSIGLFELIATRAVGGQEHFALLQLIFGFLYPVVLVLFVSTFGPEKRLLFWRWFYVGWVAYLALGFVLLAIDGVFFANVATAGLGAAVISLRYNFQDTLFSLIMGNANKTSNYLLLLALIGPVLLGLDNRADGRLRADQRLYRVFFVLAAVMMTLMFSRLVILLLPLVVLFRRKHIFASRRMERIALGSAAVLIVGVYIRWAEQINIVARYLFTSAFLEGEAQGFLGSGTGRFAQWAELSPLLTDPKTGFFGIGYGTYGDLQDCPGCGTHNLFLDHWVASGPYGVFVLVTLIGIGSLYALVKSDRTMLVTLAVFAMLAMREYSMAYLNVTSMGGLLFMVMFYCLLVARRQPRAVPTSP